MISINKKAVLAILAFGVSSTTADSLVDTDRSLASEPIFCNEALDCRECVEKGCGWAIGRCMDSCDQIADASCFSRELFPDMNSHEICRIDWTNERNWEICSGGQPDCTTCTSRSLYNPADGNCWWHPETNSCQPSRSDWMSQGTDVCPEVSHCSQAGYSCGSCLQVGCVWAAGMCIDSCMDIADAACYAPENFPNKHIGEICRMSDEDDCQGNDSHKTGSMNTINTSNPEASKCSQAGSSCGSCLEAGCEWAAGMCIESCMEIADAACYGKENFPGLEMEAICMLVEDQAKNEELCTATSCGECTSTMLVENGTSTSNTCAWYSSQGDSTQGWCGTGGCDMMGNCGSTACAAPLNRALKGSVRGASNQPSQGITSFFRAMFEP